VTAYLKISDILFIMVFWNEINVREIDWTPSGKEEGRWKYKLGDGPLRFQIPRGECTWGVNAYKSLQISNFDPKFIEWWKELENQLCPQEPFNSNMKNGSLRLKIDESTYIFDKNSKQITPDIEEGLFKGQDLSCLIDIDSNYFFKGVWGLTVRVFQIKCYGSLEPESEFKKGACAFL
jgi:hypothetical protein